MQSSKHLCKCLGFSVLFIILISAPVLPQEKPIHFNLAYSSISGSQAIVRVIADAGIFQKNSLDVNLVFIAGGSRVIQAVIAGDAPIAVVSGEPSILARLQGADTLLLASLINIMDFSIIASPELKKPQDLKGKKVAISRYGSSTDFVVRYALERWGMSPEKDVALLQIGSQADRFAALKAGSVQATIVGPPGNIMARRAGFNELATSTQLNLAYPNTTLVTTASTIVKYEDLVKRTVKSFVEGIHFLKTDKEASLKSMNDFLRLNDPELIKETYQHYSQMFAKVPYPDLKGIENVLREGSKKDSRAKMVKPESLMDIRFLKELETSGIIQRLYR